MNSADVFTSAHALAEAYATLSGDPRFQIQPSDAAQMVEDLANTLFVRELTVADHCQVISSTPLKGVRGGTIYDVIHAETARRCACKQIRTLNIAVAPDLTVLGL